MQDFYDDGQAAYALSSVSETEESEENLDGSSDEACFKVPGSSHHSDLNLSEMNLNEIPPSYLHHSSSFNPKWVKSLALHHNQFSNVPVNVSVFSNLVALDASNNAIKDIPESLCRLSNMKVLLLKNNQLDINSLPKNFNQLRKLEVLNISGNSFTAFPSQLFNFANIKALYAGGNYIRSIPADIGIMLTLEILYLGGNHLREVPESIGELFRLASLVLSDNRLEKIPISFAKLQNLESLSLHNNKLTVLPTEILTLKNLQQLSIRANPLVNRFIRDMTFQPPTLKELAGRVIKVKKMSFKDDVLPRTLKDYLTSGHECVNPKCKGVYFDSRVEHVKFTDFCGKYRVPFMQYLCSPKCETYPAYAITESSAEDSDAEASAHPMKMKKVLLG